MLNRRQTVGLIRRERGIASCDAHDRRQSAGLGSRFSCRHSSQYTRNCGALLSLIALSACGTTRRFVEQPHLTIDEPQKETRQAIAELYGQAMPFTIRLCEADPSSKECKQGSEGITATGVGGLLLPLTLHVTGITVSKQSRSVDGWAIDASFQSRVDTISPLCQTAHGQILSRDNATVSVQLRNFYCNWLVVGNVVVNADLSIDHIDLKDKAFTGFYRVTFHGTGNAAGSGYYRAAIVPKGS